MHGKIGLPWQPLSYVYVDYNNEFVGAGKNADGDWLPCGQS